VATDHVIESFRNGLWSGYKTGDGIEPALFAQFHSARRSLAAMGVAVWPMVELEADDALASGARFAAEDDRVQKVCIWTPDKDLAQCVPGRAGGAGGPQDEGHSRCRGCPREIRVPPHLIPDFLALVGDAADGYPGLAGSVKRPRHVSSVDTVSLRTFHRVCSASAVSWRCFSRNWRRSRLTPGFSAALRSCNGARPLTDFAACVTRLGDARLLTRSLKAALAG